MAAISLLYDTSEAGEISGDVTIDYYSDGTTRMGKGRSISAHEVVT